MVEVTKKSGCYEFILQLENGFDTVVGGAGGHLSGGERQRISIARAMLKDGNVTAHGTHEQLLVSCPLYKEMWNAHISVKDTVREGV